jgi:hypothetical protein
MTILERTREGGWIPPRDRESSAFKREPLPLPLGNSFVRLLTAHIISQVTRTPIATVVEERWPSDRIIMRAASAPAMTGVAGWAAELAQKIVTDGLAALGPVSAAAKLLNFGMVLSFDRHGIISAPGFTAAAGNAGFVAEGQPIPVRQLAATGAQLLPYKLAAIGVLTREMIESSNAEQMIGDVLTRAEGLALDAAFFDSSAATAARPAGLRNGIAALTPSASTDPFGGFYEDLSTLIGGVAPVGGPFVLVTSYARAGSISARFPEAPSGLTVLGCNAVGNDMLAIAPAALVSAFSPDPEIETSNAASLVMNDVAAPIVNGGAPAAPVRSLLQTDSIALKVRWPIAWALRSPAAVAWVTPSWK